MMRRSPLLLLLPLFASGFTNVGQPAFASSCVTTQRSNTPFDIVADVTVLSVDESGTAATVALTRRVKGNVPLKVFAVYSYRPTPSPDVDSPVIPPSNTLFMQAGMGLRIRGRWAKYLPPFGRTPARMEIDLCSTEVIDPPGPFMTTVSSASYRVNAGNDALVHSTTRLLLPLAQRPALRLDLGNAPSGVTLRNTTVRGDATDFLLSTAASTEAGVYEVEVVATSPRLTRTIPFVLRITRDRPGFAIFTQLSSTTVVAGASTTAASRFVVSLETIGGFAGAVDFQVSGLPNDATAVTTQTTAGATIQIATKTSTPPGRYPLLIMARSGAQTATLPATFEVVTGLAT